MNKASAIILMVIAVVILALGDADRALSVAQTSLLFIILAKLEEK